MSYLLIKGIVIMLLITISGVTYCVTDLTLIENKLLFTSSLVVAVLIIVSIIIDYKENGL